MRKAYLTPENIATKSRQLLNATVHFRKARCEYSPDKSALLVLDMQRYFLDEQSHAFIPSTPAIVPGLHRLMESYKHNSLPVICTRHINDRDDAAMMDKWWQELITRDNPLSEIDDRFNTDEIEVIEKTQYDAFHNTLLEDRLRQKGVIQVVVCGVMTHLCCESTARSAFMRGFEVFFPVDGTATYNEQYHQASLLNLSHGFAELVMIEELLEVLKVRHDS